MRAEIKGAIFLVIAAIIWGFALVAQKAGTESMGPLYFTGIRCLLGGISMIPLVYVISSRAEKNQWAVSESRKVIIRGGIVCGVLAAFFISMQQIGIAYTSVGKAGFITAIYIILVPVTGIFLKRKVGINIFIAAAIAMIGFYIMCLKDGFSEINTGDVMMILTAIGCTAHIYFIDYFVKKANPVSLSMMQFIIAGIICLILAVLFEDISWGNIKDAIIPLLYGGVCSCGLGYTFQMIGQKYVEPSKASLILSSETIFTMIAGMIFFGEILSANEYLGCGLIFIAIILSQIQMKRKE